MISAVSKGVCTPAHVPIFATASDSNLTVRRGSGVTAYPQQTWHDQYMIPGSPVFTLPEGVVLLDVREDDEWTAGHAPEAIHVPMGQVPQRVTQIAAAFPEPPVYVVCRSGVRSAQITAYLLGIGLDAVNVEGGMESWVADGRRLVAETSAPPQVL